MGGAVSSASSKFKGRIVVLEEGQESFNFLGNSFTTSISKFKIASRLLHRPMRIPVIRSELNVLAAANDFFPQPLPSPSTFFPFSNLLVKESHSKHTNREILSGLSAAISYFALGESPRTPFSLKDCGNALPQKHFAASPLPIPRHFHHSLVVCTASLLTFEPGF
jgi:hypothetical protein